MSVDVLQAIDELVATAKCPHCERDWHRAPVTQAVDRMFRSGRIEANYFTGRDTTAVLCDGSEFIGPLRPDPPPYTPGGLLGLVYSAPYLDMNFKLDAAPFLQLTDAPDWSLVWPSYTYPTAGTIKGYSFGPWILDEWTSTPEPEPCDLPEVDVKFGPDNWLKTEPVDANQHPVQASVSKRWNQFTAIDTHAPKPSGMDLSKVYTDDQTDEPYWQNKKFKKKGKKHEGI